MPVSAKRVHAIIELGQVHHFLATVVPPHDTFVAIVDFLHLPTQRRIIGDRPQHLLIVVVVFLGCFLVSGLQRRNNRTRWCAGSAWVKGVPSDCVLSMG